MNSPRPFPTAPCRRAPCRARLAGLLLVLAGLLGPAATASADAPDRVAEDRVAPDGGIPLVGINLAGAEFAPHVLPGKLGRDFHFPEKRHLDYYRSKGIRLIRFPFLWERIQPELGERLNFRQVRLLKKVLSQAAANDQQVILDMHNYARYRGELIGSSEVPYEAYADVWRRLAQELKGHRGLLAYDIMNEPHGTVGLWPGAAQAAVDAIREVDRQTLVIIEGDRWANAWHWPRVNGSLDIQDPADNLMYQAHLYFDEDFSGKYLEPEEVDPMLGVERARPFVEWLQRNGHRGFLGEYGAPDDAVSMLEAMDNLLDYLNRHCIPSAYWAAGPGWGDYALAIEPRNRQDRPQMDILQKHIDNDCQAYGPAAAASATE